MRNNDAVFSFSVLDRSALVTGVVQKDLTLDPHLKSEGRLAQIRLNWASNLRSPLLSAPTNVLGAGIYKNTLHGMDHCWKQPEWNHNNRDGGNQKCGLQKRTEMIRPLHLPTVVSLLGQQIQTRLVGRQDKNVSYGRPRCEEKAL